MKNKNFIILSSLVVLSIITFIILVSSVVTTNPTRLGPGGVTFWFINLLVMFSSMIALALYYLRYKKTESKTKLLISSFRSGVIIGLSLTLLLALSSLRSLSWRDILLLGLLVVLVEVFFRTRRVQK